MRPMARGRPINLPAPYLRRIWLDPDLVPNRDRYPFGLAAFRDGFELSFETPITIIVGEKRDRIYIFDEPESALSPARQIAFLRLVGQMDRGRRAQVILATHSPLLMSFPGATLLAATPRGFVPTTLEETSHFRLLREYAEDPHTFVRRALANAADDNED